MNTTAVDVIKHANAKWALWAGLVGGLAEVLWIAMYASATEVNAIDVARGVALTVFGSAGGGALAPALGLLVHFLLSAVVAALFAVLLWPTLWHRFGPAGVLVGAVIVLAAIWAVNFLILLPRLNASFVSLMPLAVTLISKILFGVSMGLVLSSAHPAQGGSKTRP